VEKILRWAVLALTLIGVLIATPSAASADDGDGYYACNSGELCFIEYANNTTYYKHFYNGANHWTQENCTLCHSAYTFHPDSHRLMDNANSFRNRDTQCNVYVWDVDGQGNWYPYMGATPGNATYQSTSNRNNGHTRCQSGSSPRTL